MNRNILLTLASAALVFAIGAGLGRVPADATSTIARDVDGRPLPMLPTVVVSAAVPGDEAVDAGNVILDDAVLQARTAISDRVGKGVRRVGLAIPYYAFGRNARSSE